MNETSFLKANLAGANPRRSCDRPLFRSMVPVRRWQGERDISGHCHLLAGCSRGCAPGVACPGRFNAETGEHSLQRAHEGLEDAMPPPRGGTTFTAESLT